MKNELKQPYCKIDPNSYKVYYQIDPGDPEECVIIQDEILKFTWQRKESNKNKDILHHWSLNN